ncbi:hypothetical protein B0T36_22950 [Nocardia donostiensis]|uniref:hypothetical protein n=1 Tax=Nocardia donostiensis TaxID=1538463 RepID=UPI0009DA40A3|nr:hypothetical protein [Nocardia donostiensis]OQS12823.1 hypothetical protein B0T36_22950 [Nocardia donostiensis]
MSKSAVSDALGRCHYYRTVCNLPCHIDDSGRLVLTIGAGTRALTTPEQLGATIHTHLNARNLLGPIIWHRSGRYTVLTTYSPEVEQDSLYSSALLRTNSLIIPPLGTVALPSPGDHNTYRRWIHPARDAFRPSMQTVLDTLLECATR